MTRVALTGTIGAAVLVAALGLFFAIYQQDQDETGEAGQSARTSASQQTGTGEAPATGGEQGQAGGATGTTTANATQQAAQGQQQDGGQATEGQAVPPSFDVVRVNPSGDAVIAGRAQPGALVTILDRGAALGSVTADGRGEWVFLPNAALAPGQHDFTLESSGPGMPKLESSSSVVVIVPEVAKDIAGRASDQQAGALAIEVPKSGEGPTRVLNVPNASPDAVSTESKGPEISAIDYDADGRAILSGRAPSGARLFVYVDNKPIGETTAAEDGSWAFTPKAAIAPGLHVIRVDQVDESGKVLARAETPFEQAALPLAAATGGAEQETVAGSDGTASTGTETASAGGEAASGDATATAGGKIVVQPGNSLWKLARDSYGAGVRYTVIYEANKDQITNPDLIYPGQVFSVPPEN